MKLIISFVDVLKTADDAEQISVVSLIGRTFSLKHRNHLPLIDKIDIASERRGRPGVAQHAEPVVRTRNGAHAHASHALTSVDACHSMLFEPQPPRLIGKNHHFFDQQIKGLAAHASLDRDAGVFAFAVELNVPIDAALHFGLASALLSERAARLAKSPQVDDLIGPGKVESTLLDAFFRNLVLQDVNAQIFSDCYALESCFRRNDAHRFIIDQSIERQTRHSSVLIKTGGLHPVFGKHRRLESRRVNSRHAGSGSLVDVGITIDEVGRRGNVHADARAAVGKVLNARRIIDLGR